MRLNPAMIRLQYSFMCVGWLVALTASGNEPLVTTDYGTIRGRVMSVKDTKRTVHAFLGIPYAKPPVGSLRFAPPQPPEPWNGIRDGTKHPPACMQLKVLNAIQNMIFSQTTPEVDNSEDCLHLNVYVPQQTGLYDDHRKKCVMVFLHGGAFMFGAASLYDGSALAASGNNIIVIIQYRLGVLGYFHFDEKDSGNYGLMDQVQALQWTKKNIPRFGGDPDSITIFGQSAGSVSVVALMLSPKAKGLFKGAIAQSGSALTYGLFYPDPKDAVALSNLVANATGCIKNNSADKECLRSKTAAEVNKPLENGMPPLLPLTTDGVYLQESPDKLMSAKKVNRVPIIIGTTDDECGYWLHYVTRLGPFPNGIPREGIAAYLQVQSVFEGPLAKFLPRMVEKYVGEETDPIKIRDSLLQMCKDSVFRVPARRTADYLTKSGISVYLYEFRLRTNAKKRIKPNYVHCDHGDELPFVFGSPFFNADIKINGTYTNEEKQSSKMVMKIWDAFADNGTPNLKGLPKWPVWNDNRNFLVIDKEFTIETSDMEDKMKFWDGVYSEMGYIAR